MTSDVWVADFYQQDYLSNVNSMTFTFTYKGIRYAEEEILQRINDSISVESDNDNRLLLINLSNVKLKVLKSLLPDIQEICDCLFLQKYMAATTLTNHVFETMVKLTLVYHEANGRTLDDGYEFENIYEKELNDYGTKNLGENITALYQKGIITSEGRDRLFYLKNQFRNPYSHGSNNEYVNSATTTLYKGCLGSDKIENCKVSVTGNPNILLSARREFIRRYGLSYFAEIVSYIEILDKALYKLYQK